MRRLLLLLALAFPACAAVLDRVAVTVGKDVITESEIVEEIRLDAFLNRTPVDLGPASRRAAAERMVDQDLIRTEMKLEGTPTQPVDVTQTLQDFRKAHFRLHADYLASLKKYGISEDQLKSYLSWQTVALRFTEQRFPVSQTADANSGDEQLDAWLKQTRTQTKITFHKEALE